MDTIYIYLIKTNALIAVFYILYRFLLSRDTFYNNARWFLLFGLLASVFLPLITFQKVIFIDVKPVFTVFNNNLNTTVAIMPVEKHSFNYEILICGLYFAVCTILFLKTIVEFYQLYKIIFKANAEKRNNLLYINSKLTKTPFSFFNYIVFNAELINPQELENIGFV